MSKKLLTLSLLLALTLLFAGNVLAAVHNFGPDYFNPTYMYEYSLFTVPFEGWYYIEPSAPTASVQAIPSYRNTKLYSLEYYQNDQTFANLTFVRRKDDETISNLNASYLFKNNLFLGINLSDRSFDSAPAQKTVVPGYRFNLGKDGYLAASLNYSLTKDGYYQDKGVLCYEINGRYYTPASRVYGQTLILNEDVAGSDATFWNLGGAYQITPQIVLGGDYLRIESDDNTMSRYNVGVTSSFGKLGAELSYDKYEIGDDDSMKFNTYDFNFLYSLTKNFRAGLELYKLKVEDEDVSIDPYHIIKAKWDINPKNSLIVMRQLQNDSMDEDAVTYLRWNYSFKTGSKTHDGIRALPILLLLK